MSVIGNILSEIYTCTCNASTIYYVQFQFITESVVGMQLYCPTVVPTWK